MEAKIEYYPTSGHVVEIATENGTYQLSPERDPYKAESNKETIDELIKEFDKKASIEYARQCYEKELEKLGTVDFRRQIAEEMSREELIERICEMNGTVQAFGFLKENNEIQKNYKFELPEGYLIKIIDTPTAQRGTGLLLVHKDDYPKKEI